MISEKLWRRVAHKIELDMDKIAKNPRRRQMCTILLNSFW